MAKAPKSFRPHKTAISGQLQGHFLLFSFLENSFALIFNLTSSICLPLLPLSSECCLRDERIPYFQERELCFLTLWEE